MSNPKHECPFCKEKVVATYWLKHLLKQHESAVFDPSTTWGKENRRKVGIYKTAKPFTFDLPSKQDNHCCLHCQVSCVKYGSAEKHFAKADCRAGHMSYLTEMKEKFSDITITTTTTTTTTIQGVADISGGMFLDPKTAEGAAFLKLLAKAQYEVQWARSQEANQNKKLAILAKKYNIPEDEIRDISEASSEGSRSRSDSQDEEKEKVEYEKAQKFHIRTACKVQFEKAGLKEITQQQIDAKR